MSEPPLYAIDTSVAVPILIANHSAHQLVARWADDQRLAVSGHALSETYAVITRLPGDARVSPPDAAKLIDDRFRQRLVLASESARNAHRILAEAGISGGATYDGLVALAARERGVPLATRDGRARLTYEALGVRVLILS